MKQRLHELLATRAYDLISVESSWLCSYWPMIRQAPGSHVLELYDIVADYLERRTSLLPRGPWRCLSRHDTGRMRHMEDTMVGSSDLVVVTSDRERDALKTAHPGQNIITIPNGVDTENIKPLPVTGGHEVLFVGALDYFPNRDGITFFAKEVLPILREAVPDVVVHVVGRNPPAEILALAGTPGLNIVGEADSVEPWYRRACLSVVPLRAGGGTRLKIPESMAYGRPVVTTALGCEGLEVEHRRHLLIADTPRSMAECMAEIMRDAALAQRLTEQGLELVRARYAWRNIAQQLHEAYTQTLSKQT